MKVSDTSIIDVVKIAPLFEQAVDQDYSFYNKKARHYILKRHSSFNILKAMVNPNKLVIKAVHKNKIVGILLGSLPVDGVGVVTWLYVTPENRKNGIAKKLLSAAEKRFKELGCHKLTVSTEIAQKFYLKVGYSQEGKLLKHWWEKDFYIFGKTL